MPEGGGRRMGLGQGAQSDLPHVQLHLFHTKHLCSSADNTVACIPSRICRGQMLASGLPAAQTQSLWQLCWSIQLFNQPPQQAQQHGQQRSITCQVCARSVGGR